MRFVGLLACAAVLSACSASESPSASAGVATNGSQLTLLPSASPSGGQSTGTRTVLTPIGLNVRAQAAPSAAKLGSAAQGTVLTVIGQSPDNGGWYQVKGSTITGWISADPSLTTAQPMQSYQSSAHGFNALYRADWTFQDTSTNVTFLPAHGSERLTVTTAQVTAQLPTPEPGLVTSQSESVVVCGITAVLRQYTTTSRSTLPTPGSAPPTSHIALINIGTGSIAFQLRFAFDTPDQLADLRDFYNAMSFSAPQCLG